jgi:hypothetical protein
MIDSIKDPRLPTTPITILDPKCRSEKLDSPLQYPELVRNKDSFFIDSKGRKRGNVSKQIQEYIGSDAENQLAFKNDERNMKFVPLLVEATSEINQKKKYILASDFLLGSLGADLNPEQIKDKLRQRVKFHSNKHTLLFLNVRG